MNRNAWSSFRSFAGIVRRLLPGLAVMLMAGTGQANIINLTHPYTNTTIAAVIANAATVDGDVILVNTNVQTENGIVVSKGVTLMGLGQNTTIVQGATARSNATDRIFNVLAGGGAGIWKSFTLSNMTIRYGYTTNDGAGLQVDYNNSPYWTTTVDRVTFTMNDQHAGIGSGGGAIVQNKWPSILIIRNSSFSSNTTSKAGGAIYLRGMGGMEISGSTFAQNQAASGGGGLYMDYVTSGMTTIKNSTFAYNSTPGSTGGGIYFGGRSAFTGAVYNCTFYSNSATYGGGIFIENDIGTPGTVRLTSCLLASNSAPTAPELYIRSGVPTTISNCLAQGGIGGTGTYTDGGGNQTNVNAKVLPLADNGGPTLTCAIASDSPARDAGSNPLSLAADQRGTGFTRTRGTVTDIGAFEYGASAVTYPGTFIEVYPFNSGAINNTANLLITIVGGETFTGTDCSQITNNVVVTNLPAGLTLSMIRTNNGTAALVALLGNAAQQAQSNTVTNLGFTFLDAAFTLGNASQLGSYSVTNQTVQFYDAVAGGALAYGGTNFLEDATWNDGRIATANSISLTGDFFNGNNGEDFVANGWVVPANIPAGLTAVVTRVSSTNVSVTLSGRATAHAAANSTNNLGLTFLNAAFFGNNASLIANAAVPNLDVTFLDPATNVQLLYGGTVFAESTNNDGSIATTIGITLTNDLFNGNNGDDFVGKGWVVPANVPAGLTAVVTRVDLTHVNASLAGKAAANSSSDSIGNLTLTFQNNSFYNTAAFAVTNSSRSDLAVQFLNPVLTYIGNGFREFWQNNGAIDNNSPVQVNLAGETFAGSVGANLLGAGVTVANVPSGLTAVVTKKASQTVAITLTGVAPANEAADSITNLTVSFGDAAFAASPASIVANSGPTNLAVTFYSAASNLYVATVANGGSDSNDGSLAHPFATLKKAVSVARANNNDTINVLAGTYTESNIVVNGKTVTIQGAGKTNTIVQGAVAPFSGVNQYIFWMTGSQTMALRDMTIRYGDYTNGTPQGSAIYSTVPGLYVTGCSLVSNNMVSANTVAGGSALSLGGGPAARATVLNCDVIGNTVKAVPGAGSYGGGIAVWQSLVISNGIFSGNVATNGGALYVNPGCPSLSVYDSSFNGNSANIYGGAVMVDRATNTLFQGCSFISNSVINSGGGLEVEASATAYTYLINCTFAGNTAGGGGGFLGHYDSRARIYNCTFVGNTAGTGGGAAMAHCTSWVIDSTIMASNNATTAPDLDQGDGVNLHAVTNCLIGNNSGCATIFPAGLPNAKGCYVGTAGTNLNPLVGVPSDNGGPTWTCALLPGSPAIDHGDNPLGLDWDQRGYKHVRVFKAQCDIGAFEFSLPTGLLFIVQ